MSSEQSSAGRCGRRTVRWERRLPRSARVVSSPIEGLMTADCSREAEPAARNTTIASAGPHVGHSSDSRPQRLNALGALERRSMARKLKSDKLLFTATLLLVCTSVVMVYSASAVIAMERFQTPYLFLIKQIAWALLGLAVAADRDAHRLPHLPAAGGHLDGARHRRRWRWSRAVQAARQRRDALARRRPVSACSRRSSRRSRSSSSWRRCSNGGWTASTTSATRCCRSAWSLGLVVGLILLEPDLGTARVDRR